jgi:hypothetical protein
MSFIKNGDGKITDVFDEDGLTEEQKKSVKEMSEKKVAKEEEPSKVVKKSGS